MKIQKWIGGGMLAITLLTFGCRPSEDWNDPKWITYALEHNHPKALGAYGALEDAQKLEALPAVIAAYNANTQQRDVLRALQTVDDPRTVDVFRNALLKTDDDLAVLGARGLAARGVAGSAPEIADRLRSVSSPGAFLGMVESIETLDPGAGVGVMASLLQRPAERIGGVPVVKAGCRILEKTSQTTEEIVDSIVLGMVNFTARPYVDPMPECENAALRHVDGMNSAISELYLGKNERANDLVRAQGFSDAPARLRGAIYMSHLRTEELNAAYRQFLGSRFQINAGEFDAMTTEQQMAYYDNMGQLFEISVKGLSYSRNPEDRALIRSLVDPAGGLTNFAALTRLGTTGEVGYRQAAATALVAVGNASDKSFLWNEATSATVSRGGVQGATLYHLNVIHALGRIAAKGDMANFRRAFNAQPSQWQHEFRGQYGYFAVGEACDRDLECLTNAALNPDSIVEREDVQAWIQEDREDRREMLTQMMGLAVQSGAVWQIAMYHPDAAGSKALVRVLTEGGEGAIAIVPEALLHIRDYDASVTPEIEAWLEGPIATRTGPGVADMRHLMSVIAKVAKK